MASDASIDPRLLPGSQTQPHPQPLPQTTLPSRSLENADDDDSDDEGNEGTEKRRKLNLWKCKQCRDARKKVPYTRSLVLNELFALNRLSCLDALIDWGA